MFNIFKRKKKMSVQELREQYKPVLDDVWVLNFRFNPWAANGMSVDIRKVGIVYASADRDGIFVKSDKTSKIFDWDCVLCGYLDKIKDISSGWTGFFETEEAAKKAYADTMAKWIAAMQKSVEIVCGKGACDHSDEESETEKSENKALIERFRSFKEVCEMSKGGLQTFKGGK